MNPKHVKELLHASPFMPFTIVLANGKLYHIGNPDVLNVTAQGKIIHEEATGPSTFINPLLILEIISGSEATGT
jgi:hypothetical protein